MTTQPAGSSMDPGPEPDLKPRQPQARGSGSCRAVREGASVMTDEVTMMGNDATDIRRLDRRTVLGGAAAAAAAGLASHIGAAIPAAAQDASPAAGEGGKATFVLVHGA